jgi:hypothetical protein
MTRVERDWRPNFRERRSSVVCSRRELHTHFRRTHTPVPSRPTGQRTVAFM